MHVDKGMDPADIDALYLGNFSNDYFAHQAHWRPPIHRKGGEVPETYLAFEPAR